MQYDFDQVVDRSKNLSAKYDERVKKFGTDDVIPLWIADMDFRTAQPVIDALKARAEEGIWGYTARPASYFEAVKNWQKRRNGWDIDPKLMSFSLGVVQTISACVKLFTPEGGSIFVSCHRSAGVITIRVRDTGTGIPQNALPHIFEKFYQADSSHATKGNGLGLPLAKKIVEVCGGRIGVQSDLGKGTEFTVILPDGGNLLGKNSSRSELNLGGEE